MKKVFTLILWLVFSFTGYSQPCPSEYYFTTQAQIDSFHIIYPYCTEIDGDVIIGDLFGGGDINNLNGLSVLNYIGGQITIWLNDSLTSLMGLQNITSCELLRIVDNDALTNLTGLEGLSSIEEELSMSNNSVLTSLTGLENLSSIGFALILQGNDALTNLTGLEGLSYIGSNLNIKYNDALINFSGLDNLTFIGSTIVIDDNDALTSLTGLDNVDGGTLENLEIIDNELLSLCDVQSICDYLAGPPWYGDVYIENNATGCNSQEEVEVACGVGVEESSVIGRQSSVSIYPNPSSNVITIELLSNKPTKNTVLTIYNLSGQALSSRQISDKQTVVDVSGLPKGIYFVRVSDDRTVMVSKFIKQ